MNDKLIKLYYAFFRNNYTISKTRVKHKCVNLEYWQRTTNVGDLLAPIIYRWMLNRKGINPNKKTKKTIHLLTLGSILAEGIIPVDAVVWGTGIHHFSGVIKLGKYSKLSRLDVRAVRGPVTAHILKLCGYDIPDKYGDPGVLMPLIYQGDNAKQYECSIIRHYSHQGEDNNQLHSIDTRTSDIKFFIDEICRSRLIISSSLHGIILAEAYGVPAIFLQDGMDEELIKYYDWYYSTGRRDIKFAYSVDEALKMEPMEKIDLRAMQSNLIESFPYDLWD